MTESIPWENQHFCKAERCRTVLVQLAMVTRHTQYYRCIHTNDQIHGHMFWLLIERETPLGTGSWAAAQVPCRIERAPTTCPKATLPGRGGSGS